VRNVGTPAEPLGAARNVLAVCDEKLDAATDKVPPSVSEPLVVTVPVSVRPLTVPVPATEVTVPVLLVYPLGLAAGYAPRLVSAPAAVVAFVPPLAIGSVPVTCDVKLTPDSVPPSVRLPLVVTVPVKVMPLTVPVPPTLVTVPPPAAAAMVMPPALFVMAIPVPAVSVAFVRVLPVLLPMSNWPSVYVVCPVPPLVTATAPVSFDAASDVIHDGLA